MKVTDVELAVLQDMCHEMATNNDYLVQVKHRANWVVGMLSVVAIMLSIILYSSVVQAEDTDNLRLLWHGHRAIGENGWGVASWVVAPNVTAKSNKWLVFAGPRYDGTGWFVEAMLGAKIEDSHKQFMLDTRWELNPKLWNIPLLVWGNEEVFDLSFQDWTIYSYLRVVYVLPAGLGMAGVETEDLNFMNKSDDYSIGVHIIIPIAGPFVIIPAYQWHFVPGQGYTGGQFWLRVVLDFKDLKK